MIFRKKKKINPIEVYTLKKGCQYCIHHDSCGQVGDMGLYHHCTTLGKDVFCPDSRVDTRDLRVCEHFLGRTMR